MKGVLYSVLLLSGTLFAQDEYFYACLDCSQSQAKSKFMHYLEQFSCDSKDPRCTVGSPDQAQFFKGHIFTDTGADKGYSFVGQVNGPSLSIYPFFNGAPSYAKLYYSEMDKLREDVHQLVRNINSDLAAFTGYGEVQKTKEYINKVVRMDCPTNASPFRYFHQESRGPTEGLIHDQAQYFADEAAARISNLTVSIGRGAISAGANIVLNGDHHYLSATYANGGELVWELEIRGSRVEAHLRLGLSTIGNGLRTPSGAPVTPSVPIDTIINQNSDGSFSLNGADFSIADACVAADIEDVIEELATSYETQLGVNGNEQVCDAHRGVSTNGYTTWGYWREWVEVRVHQGRAELIRHREYVSVQVPDGTSFQDFTGCS